MGGKVLIPMTTLICALTTLLIAVAVLILAVAARAALDPEAARLTSPGTAALNPRQEPLSGLAGGGPALPLPP
jgi:hypothetical protein